MVSIGKKGKMLRPRMGGLRNRQGLKLNEESRFNVTDWPTRNACDV